MRRKRVVIECILIAILIAVGLPSLLIYREWQQQHLNKALIVAIHRNDKIMVLSLLKEGADANALDDYVPNPTLKWLIARYFAQLQGKKPVRTSTHSALCIAIYDYQLADPFKEQPDNIPIIQALLDHGADPNKKLTGDHSYLTLYNPPLLIWEVAAGKPEVIYLLLQHGADPDDTDRIGRTAIMYSIIYSRDKISTVNMLLNYGAKINQKDWHDNTALMYAVESGDKEVLRCLLAHGANVNARNTTGRTALKMAQQKDQFTMINLLKRAGARN